MLRLASFHQNVLHGGICCRWFPDFAWGLGLPVLEYFPVSPLIFAESFRLMGFSTINSLKILIVMMTFFAAFGAWLLGNSLWGKSGGYITSILFSYAPYKMVNLYVRGDLNEYMAMAVSPWILYLILSSAKQENPGLLSFATTAAMCIPAITHYPSSVIHYPMYLIWISMLAPAAHKPARYLARNILSLGLGLWIASPFWVSAFFSRHLVQMENMTKGFADYKQHFIYFKQYFSFYWNYGASVLGPGDAISFQIGNAALLCFLIGIPITLKQKNKNKLITCAVLAASTILIISIFLTHQSSQKIWQLLPILPLIQFPYRLLSIASVLAALLGGSIGVFFDNRFKPHRKVFTITTSIIVILGSLHMCRAIEYLNIDENDLTPENIRRVKHTHSTGEQIPMTVQGRFPPPEPVTFTLKKIPETGFTREQTEARLAQMVKNTLKMETWTGSAIPLGNVLVYPNQTDILQGDIQIDEISKTGCRRVYKVNAATSGEIRINQFYFEGWTTLLDNTPFPAGPDSETGLIKIDLPQGQYLLTVSYRNLPISRILAKMSFFTIIIFLLYGVSRKIYHERKIRI
ncbi:MAG: 6-pyruvoyl-tetrahydropterin synthase-related protein [bacterium]